MMDNINQAVDNIVSVYGGGGGGGRGVAYMGVVIGCRRQQLLERSRHPSDGGQQSNMIFRKQEDMPSIAQPKLKP